MLELAKTASNPTDKMICLRGYLRLAGQADLPLDKRLAMCRQAAPLAQKDDEKKLLLAALGGIVSVEALDLITPYLDEAGHQGRGCRQGGGYFGQAPARRTTLRRWPPKLIEPLDKVAQATANADLAKRAKELLDQAKSKAGAK